VIVAAGFLIAARPHISSNVIVGLLIVGAVAAIGVGVAGAVAGARDVEEHEEEGGNHEGALPPLAVPAAVEVAG
jgi:hypothetical protein